MVLAVAGVLLVALCFLCRPTSCWSLLTECLHWRILYRIIYLLAGVCDAALVFLGAKGYSKFKINTILLGNFNQRAQLDSARCSITRLAELSQWRLYTNAIHSRGCKQKHAVYTYATATLNNYC